MRFTKQSPHKITIEASGIKYSIAHRDFHDKIDRFQCSGRRCQLLPFLHCSEIHGELRMQKLCDDGSAQTILRNIFINQSFNDGFIVALGGTIPVHRAVMAEASPVFQRMFGSECREGFEARIKLKASAHTVAALVAHCYGQRVPTINS